VRRSIQDVLSEYGPVALVVYLVIYLAVIVGAWSAIHLGWRPESVAGSAGVLATAYLVTRASLPLRIGATLLLTPLVARAYARVSRKRPEATPAPLAETPRE